jgi:hypothetical protein
MESQALYDLVKYVAGAVLLSFSGLAVFTGPKLMSAVYLFAALMGLYLMASAFLFRKNIPVAYDPRLAARAAAHGCRGSSSALQRT